MSAPRDDDWDRLARHVRELLERAMLQDDTPVVRIKTSGGGVIELDAQDCVA